MASSLSAFENRSAQFHLFSWISWDHLPHDDPSRFSEKIFKMSKSTRFQSTSTSTIHKSLGDREKQHKFVARKKKFKMSVVKISRKSSRRKIRVIFATGASQLNFIESLIRTKDVPWNKVECFHLDEYVGLDSNHEASFRLYS